MLRNTLLRVLTSATLLAVIFFGAVTPALAFDGRGGQNVTIAVGETVNDDLYITAQTVVVNGTVKGDLVVFASSVTLNGTVEGGLFAAGQDVIVNGTVQGDVRVAGAVLQVGAKAKIGGDILGAGASLETRPGSDVVRDAVFAGGQALLAGDVGRNAIVATGGLELGGSIAGNLKAYVGDPDKGRSGGPGSYMANGGVAMPGVSTGLTLDPSSRIGGNLDYTSTKQFEIPAGVVAGKVSYTAPKTSQVAPLPISPAQRVLNSALDTLRLAISLILLGLLLGWLFPSQLKAGIERIKSAPLPALGGGILSIAAFCFSLLVLIIATLIGAILFGVLTLGSLSATVALVGLFTTSGLVLGFVLISSFVAQIIVSTLAGQWLVGRIRPELAEHKYWPLVIGVLVFAILAALPFIGWVVNLIAVLFGLGALWFLGRQMLEKKPAAA